MKRLIFRQVDWFSIFGFILVFFIVLFMTQENTSMVSLCITGTFLYVAMGLVLKWKSLNKKLLGLAIICSFLSLINVCISSFGDFDYYKKFIMYSVSILWIVYCGCVTIQKQTLLIINLVNVLIAVIYIYAYRTGFDTFEGEVLLTMGFPNPNQTGMFLFNTILYITLIIILYDNKVVRFVSLIGLFFLLFLLYLTGCRSAFGGYVFFILLCLGTKFKLSFFYKKWFYVLWSVAPLVFLLFYMRFSSALDLDLSFGMESMGKSSSTRLSVWTDALSMLGDNFLLGDYSNVEKIIKYSHAHNTHLEVWISYGFVPLLLFIVILYKSVWKIRKHITTPFQYYALFAFLSCFVNGFFEATLISGSAGLFLLSFGFLLLANQRQLY